MDNSDNETRFDVQREKKHKKQESWSGTQIVATTGSDVTSHTDARGNGTFRFRVRAGNGFGNSAWTNWLQVTVSGGGGGPKPCHGKKCN